MRLPVLSVASLLLLAACAAVRADAPFRQDYRATVVADGRTGRLFTPDAVDEIVTLIETTTPEQLRDYGRQGLERYREHYTADRMAREMEALYREVIAG